MIRTIKLEFTDTDPTNLNLSIAGWSDKDMGGIYREEIVGFHKMTAPSVSLCGGSFSFT